MRNKTADDFWFWNHGKKPTKMITHVSVRYAGNPTLCGLWIGAGGAGERIRDGYDVAGTSDLGEVPKGPPCPTCFKQMIKEITSP